MTDLSPILRALYEGPWSRRSSQGLAKELGLSADDVLPILQDWEQRGITDKGMDGTRVFWGLTDKGKTLTRQLLEVDEVNSLLDDDA